jgi:AcrR family transcriptional regulator
MLIEQGFAALTMDRLADATEYSKGTIYQHFSTKEDLVAALAMESLEKRLALFGRARQFIGRPREQLLALHRADEIFMSRHPHYFQAELVVNLAGLDLRASSERREFLIKCDEQIASLPLAIIRTAVDQGDLRLAPPRTVNEVCFGLFSLVIGGHTAAFNCPILKVLEINNPGAASREALHTMLDGLDWKPLRKDWDYHATYARIDEELFADEHELAGNA